MITVTGGPFSSGPSMEEHPVVREVKELREVLEKITALMQERRKTLASKGPTRNDLDKLIAASKAILEKTKWAAVPH